MAERDHPSDRDAATYALVDAAADLAAAGLLRAILVARRGAWLAIDRGAPGAAATLGGGFRGAILDSRLADAGRLFVGLPGPRQDGRRFAGAALAAGAHALVGAGDGADPSAGLGPAPTAGCVLVCDDPLAGLGCLAGRWRERMTAVVCGVTGSNGKTTTKDLLAAALGGAGPVHATSGNLNSAQGVPLTLLGLDERHRYAVVEMGATAVGHIAARAALARPVIGIITNAAAAHLAEFGSLERIVEGKGELVAALPTDGTAVLNADSAGYRAWRARARCLVVSFGHDAGDHRWQWAPGTVEAPGWLELDRERWPVPLPGRHNAANLCAAILAARAAGLDDERIRAGLRSFCPSPHRADLRRLGGRLVLDDCYNANPEGMCQAARMLGDLAGGVAWAVLGGMAELGAASDELHRACGGDLAALGVDFLLAVGAPAAPLAEGFAAAGGEALTCPDHAAAAALLDQRTRPGDRILVKGSRAMAMERVLDALRERHDWREERS